ncbi:ribonuclease HI [Photobacterium aphoticum]|uniref:Ribonuclease HI n=1 Tax=Photobacterium aphoticum TaxID=754436 RepID=A0A090QZC5_9GAMM|nr:ribonuclease HI [Photobacterium aphoticum]
MLRYKQHEKELSDGFFMTTNNRMELLAAIKGLASLKEPCKVDLTTDSSMSAKGSPSGSITGKNVAGKRPIKSR